MFEPSPEKLVIVLMIALIILGPKRLPEVGRSLGKGLREFKDGISGHGSEPPNPAPAESSSAGFVLHPAGSTRAHFDAWLTAVGEGAVRSRPALKSLNG